MLLVENNLYLCIMDNIKSELTYSSDITREQFEPIQRAS